MGFAKKKKCFSDKFVKNVFTLLICPINYKYNYNLVNSNNKTLSKIVHCKCCLTSELYGK